MTVQRRRPWTEERRANHKASIQAFWADPEKCGALKERIRKGIKVAWSDPNHRFNTPEYRKRLANTMSERLKKSPELRATRLEWSCLKPRIRAAGLTPPFKLTAHATIEDYLKLIEWAKTVLFDGR
jgi:hypothetical protein